MGMVTVKSGRKTFFCVLLFVVLAAAVVEALYLFRTYSEDDMKSTVVRVRHRTGFALVADGVERLFFTSLSADSVFVGLDSVRENALAASYSTGVWINERLYFPSCPGLMMAYDDALDVDSVANAMAGQVKMLVERNESEIVRRIEDMTEKKKELDYYLSVHDLNDNEYDRVSTYASTNVSALRDSKRYLSVLRSVSDARKVEIVPLSLYDYSVNGEPDMKNITCRILPHVLEGEESVSPLQKALLPEKMVLLQSDSLEVPDCAKSVSLPLFGLFENQMTDTVYVPDFGKKKVKRIPLSKAYADKPVFDRHGRFSGFTPKECHHVGEADTLGYKVIGKTEVDSLLKGVFTDSVGTYRGYLTYDGKPCGLGVFRYNDGGYYEGEWQNGLRHGNGFYVKAGEMVRAGEWKDGIYKGERMSYNAYRVYGIDVSRYQHESGRKRFNIDWKNLRITYLGAKNSGDASDTIDYPVSFVYIKSTQGVSIKSRYYAADSREARKHGIHCGAYHFFSMKTDARKQAKYFLDNTRILSSDMPPVLDVEPSDREIAKYGGEKKLFSSIREWMNIVEASTGKRPILYVSQKFIKDHLVKAPDICEKYQVWIARYGAYRPEVKLLFWQLTPYGRVRGIHGDVDINVFNGYKEQFDSFKSGV